MTFETEKRRFPRYPVELVAFVNDVGGEENEMPRQMAVKDISQGGLYLESDFLFDVGTFVTMDLRLPGEEKGVSVTGVVRRCWNEIPSGMGIEIVQESASDWPRLRNFIEELDSTDESARPNSSGEVERRRHARIPVELSTLFLNVNEVDVVQPTRAIVTDISEGGVFVETNTHFDTGAYIALELQLPKGRKTVSFVGVVRWSKTMSSTNTKVSMSEGIGIQMVRMTKSDKERLDEFLMQQSDENPQSSDIFS